MPAQETTEAGAEADVVDEADGAGVVNVADGADVLIKSRCPWWAEVRDEVEVVKESDEANVVGEAQTAGEDEAASETNVTAGSPAVAKAVVASAVKVCHSEADVAAATSAAVAAVVAFIVRYVIVSAVVVVDTCCEVVVAIPVLAVPFVAVVVQSML